MHNADPFPHFVVTDVFDTYVYRSLEATFQAILMRGFSHSPTSDRFSRSISGYDAYAMNFSHVLDEPLRIFLCPNWHRMLASVVGVDATGDVSGGLHHHSPGSRSGSVHNDLNPAWFIGEPNVGTTRLPDPDLCDYYSGYKGSPNVAAREMIRAVAMIFYLNNPPWSPGDGGETGLYDTGESRVEYPAVSVPPINNSMLIFKCTPYSYHSFISNRTKRRNSIVMWLHRPIEEAISDWGAHKIVRWPKDKGR